MRPLLVLVALSLAASFVVVGETAAQGAQPATEFTLVAHHEGSAYYFTLEGQTARNPTLNVPPDTEVTIILKGASGVHNVQVEGQDASDYVQKAGDEVRYTFRSPASGTLQYWCVPHKGNGMVGQIRVVASGGGSGGDAGGNGTAPSAPTEYVFVGNDDGGFYWTVEGRRNPTNLPIPPNAEITIRIRNAGGVHNFQVDGAPASEYVNQEGDEVVYKFTSPASGTLQYWCVPHKGSGMAGTFRVVQPGEDAGGGGGAAEEEVNGPTVRLGDVLSGATGACADMQIPAAVGERQIGGPSAADYLQQCQRAQSGGGTPTGGGRQDHPADMVLPVSFALIALGIVGVVWVHRYYKP